MVVWLFFKSSFMELRSFLSANILVASMRPLMVLICVPSSVLVARPDISDFFAYSFEMCGQQEIFLTNTQMNKIVKANNSVDVKLSKTQKKNLIQCRGFLGSLPGKLIGPLIGLRIYYFHCD